MTTESSWINAPLHTALVNALPTFVKEPFSPSPRLNVPELKTAMRRSHETVYKALRTNRLSLGQIRKIVELANTEKNVAALSALGRSAPKVEDFYCFVDA